MRKSGLHKQVAFIFEGAPQSGCTTAEPAEKPAVASSTRGLYPDRIVTRPKPAPKGMPAPEAGLLKKVAASAAKKNNRSEETDNTARRQKMMTILVGVLSIVFVGVMLISFGGIGKPAVAPAAEEEKAAPTPVSQMDPQSWVFPEPLPAQMRNPLVIPRPQIVEAAPGVVIETAELTVRGIVYSPGRNTPLSMIRLPTKVKSSAEQPSSG